MELSSGSDDETVLVPPFAGDLDVEDNVRNIPDNQVPVGPNNAALAPNNIGHQAKNAGRAERQAPAEPLPQRGHGRYNFRNNPNPSTRLKDSLVFILSILLLDPIACGKDVYVFPEVGAIAERCGDVAVQSSSAIFSMVLRLEIPTPQIRQWHCTMDKHISNNFYITIFVARNCQHGQKTTI